MFSVCFGRFEPIRCIWYLFLPTRQWFSSFTSYGLLVLCVSFYLTGHSLGEKSETSWVQCWRSNTKTKYWCCLLYVKVAVVINSVFFFFCTSKDYTKCVSSFSCEVAPSRLSARNFTACRITILPFNQLHGSDWCSNYCGILWNAAKLSVITRSSILKV